MISDTTIRDVQTLHSLELNNVTKRNIDLLVLRYMAQRVLLTLRTLEEPLDARRPFLYNVAERYGRLHRIVLYRPQELLSNKSLAFVGFVSLRRLSGDATIGDELSSADRRMLAMLKHIPGLLGYSSLELRPGRWYNLVLLEHVDIKAHLKHIPMHQYAAYQLAPRAYEWIRIHTGEMPMGLAGNELRIVKTKHYAFQALEENLSMYEVTYGEHGEARKA